MNYIVYGLQRSGHHAIIFWILRNLAPWQSIDLNGVKTCLYEGKSDKYVYFNDWDAQRENILSVSHKYNHFPYRFVSIEERFIYPHQLRALWNHSPDKFVFVFRDILNCYSSRRKKFSNYGGVFSPLGYLIDPTEIWLQMFNIYNTLSDLYPSRVISIVYNSWLVDKNYRDNAMNKLGLTNEVDDSDFVPDIGQGSSFFGGLSDQLYVRDKKQYLYRFSDNMKRSEIHDLLSNEALTRSHRKLGIDLHALSKFDIQ